MQCPSCSSFAAETEADAPTFCASCGFPLRRVGGRFRLERLLDEGGFGIVYLATDMKAATNPLRAVKFLKPEIFSQHGVFERFQREVKLTSELSRMTPHVVFTYDSAGYDDILGHYYVMEFLQGVSLRYLLETSPPNLRTIRTIITQLGEVLEIIHSRDIAHRDLKPENIFLVRHENNNHFVKLLDFGIAKHIHEDPRQALTRGALGSPDYMSPEQCTGQKISTMVDQYALATILYEMLTGQHPIFNGSDRDEPDIMRRLSLLLRKKPTPMRHHNAQLTRSLDRVVLKALSKAPEERFSTIMQFVESATRYLRRDTVSVEHNDHLLPTDFHSAVPLGDYSYWVGIPPQGETPILNACLRLFEGTNNLGQSVTFALLINPGSSHSFGTIQAKVSSLIQGLDRLSAVFMTSSSPSVAASMTLLHGRYAPKAKLLCSENTWLQASHYRLPEDNFISIDKYPRGFKVPTGQTLHPIVLPYCPDAGSSILYDPETHILYSGALFSQFSGLHTEGFWVDERDWLGMRTWHQVMMPSTLALRTAIQRIRKLATEIDVIVPQQGCLIRGEWIGFYLDRLESLTVGMEMVEQGVVSQNQIWSKVLQRIFAMSNQYLQGMAAQRLQQAAELRSFLQWKQGRPVIRLNGQWVVEVCLSLLTDGLPALAVDAILYEATAVVEELQLPPLAFPSRTAFEDELA